MYKQIFQEWTSKLHATFSPIHQHSKLAHDLYEIEINDVTFRLLLGNLEDEGTLFIHYDFGHSLVDLKKQLLKRLEKAKPDQACEPYTEMENISFRTCMSLSQSTLESVLSTLRDICESADLWRNAYLAAVKHAYASRGDAVIH